MGSAKQMIFVYLLFYEVENGPKRLTAVCTISIFEQKDIDHIVIVVNIKSARSLPKVSSLLYILM